MTEKFSEAHDLPLYELDNTEECTEAYISNVLLQGGQLAHQTFSSEFDARDAADAYVAACRKNCESIPGIDQVDMTAMGEGVLVANIKSSADNRTGIVTYETNPTEPLVPMSMFDKRAFHYEGVISGVVEIDKNTWKAQPCIVAKELKKDQWDLNSAPFGFALTKLTSESRMIIPCVNEDVHIEVDRLVRQRQCEQALIELARQDVEKTGLADDVNRIYEVFSRERKTTSLFPDIPLLHAIGKKGIQFGSQDGKRADVLNTALARTIGVDRPLILDGKAYAADADNQMVQQYKLGFSGTVVEVISQLPVSEKKIGPTLVMMPMDNQEMLYVPLTGIASLKYR